MNKNNEIYYVHKQPKYLLKNKPYAFYIANDIVFDWGHYLRATGNKWTWLTRILAWNPCNNIGQLIEPNLDYLL